jgi:ElaB/YqjD/DUF883 family membrane-anchored ribosome-binding protein
MHGDDVMSGSSRYTRAVSAEVGEIERRLRTLEKSLEKLGARASSNARDTAESLSDAVSSALSGWAGRFRESAGLIGDQSATLSTKLGKDAAKMGSAALSRISDETERRPLFALAVAVGIGVLIGIASRHRD